MPIYDFECAQCGRFDAIRKVPARDTPAPCPACGAASPRVASDLTGLLTPRRALAASKTTPASEASEGGYGLHHAVLCACCG